LISTSYEDIRIGDIVKTGFLTVTEEYVRGFADLTGDRHPLHLDPEYAARTRFGQRIAHGALMMSTLLGLVELHPSYLQCFYGMDKVRFRAPVYLGDAVCAESEVVDIQPRPGGGAAVVTSEARLVNQDGTLVFSGLFSLLVAGRSEALAMEAQG
jgi:acyl dehydratase